MSHLNECPWITDLKIYLSLIITSFYKKSFDELNPEHKSLHAAWETRDPGFWTSKGYAAVSADERGIGQSRGRLDTMSRSTSEAFFEVIEWCAEQPWPSGKVLIYSSTDMLHLRYVSRLGRIKSSCEAII